MHRYAHTRKVYKFPHKRSSLYLICIVFSPKCRARMKRLSLNASALGFERRGVHWEREVNALNGIAIVTPGFAAVTVLS